MIGGKEEIAARAPEHEAQYQQKGNEALPILVLPGSMFSP